MSDNDKTTEVEEQPSKAEKIETIAAKVAVAVIVSFAAGALNEVLTNTAISFIKKHNKK